jgi:hypothetical protein
MGDQFGNSDADLDRGDHQLMRRQEDAPPKKRTHFVRFLTRAQVNTCIDMLNKVALKPFPKATSKTDRFECKAPDGDVVFSGIRSGNTSAKFICRMHREVFSEE